MVETTVGGLGEADEMEPSPRGGRDIQGGARMSVVIEASEARRGSDSLVGGGETRRGLVGQVVEGIGVVRGDIWSSIPRSSKLNTILKCAFGRVVGAGAAFVSGLWTVAEDLVGLGRILGREGRSESGAGAWANETMLSSLSETDCETEEESACAGGEARRVPHRP